MAIPDDPHIRRLRATAIEAIHARQQAGRSTTPGTLSPHDQYYWRLVDLFNEMPAASRLRLLYKALELTELGTPLKEGGVPVTVEPMRARDALRTVETPASKLKSKSDDGLIESVTPPKIMPKDVKPSSPIKMFETVQPDECTGRECDFMNCENTECASMMQVEVKNRLALIRLREWFFKHVIMSVTLLIFLVLVLFGMGVELPEGVASELFDDVIEIAKLVFTA